MDSSEISSVRAELSAPSSRCVCETMSRGDWGLVRGEVEGDSIAGVSMGFERTGKRKRPEWCLAFVGLLGWMVSVALSLLLFLMISLGDLSRSLPTSLSLPRGPDVGDLSVVGPLLWLLAHAALTVYLMIRAHRFFDRGGPLFLVLMTLGFGEVLLVGPMCLSIALVGAVGNDFVASLEDPNGPDRAVLYHHNTIGSIGDCAWLVYREPPVLVSIIARHDAPQRSITLVSEVLCRCDEMPEARLVWREGEPVLVDTEGDDYTCGAP